MEWFIEGADANTGEDLQLVIEADDAPTAEEQARERGMLISTISPVGMAVVAEQAFSESAVAIEVEDPPVEEAAVEESVEIPVEEPEVEPPPPEPQPPPPKVKPKKLAKPAAAAPVAHAPAPLEHANLKSRPRRGGELPEYEEITQNSKTLRVLATVASIIGGACFALAIFVLIFPFIQDDATHFSIPQLLTSGAAALIPAAFGLCLLITAAVLRLIASVALAVRDIARNSAHK